eukprot:768653-Hanusia_phi.AAC.3
MSRVAGRVTSRNSELGRLGLAGGPARGAGGPYGAVYRVRGGRVTPGTVTVITALNPRPGSLGRTASGSDSRGHGGRGRGGLHNREPLDSDRTLGTESDRMPGHH